jgi:hypothetical protein
MTKAFAWVLNQDAELELAQPGYNPSIKLRTQLERHGAAAQALLGPSDTIVKGGDLSSGVWVGRAWCPTVRALAALRAAGVSPEPHPPLEVLRLVNHRKFACDLPGGLPQQAYVEDKAQLHAALSRPGPWLLKRPLAFAGRGQHRVWGALEPNDLAWIEASFRTDGLVVEPLVKPLLEVSLHGFIWQDRRFELGRVCVQHVNERGVYQGVRLQREELEAKEVSALHVTAERVANALGTVGYFGPFGVDAYRYEHQGRPGFCALGEINARFTMAFATGFPRPAHTLWL